MKLNLINPKQSLSLAYRRQRPVRSKLNLFNANLLELLHNIEASEDESEEHAKNYIRDFLLSTYYRGTNEINTLDRKDLVIHNGKTIDDKVGVIIETKKPNSKAEMPAKEKPNCKALQELVLYYLRERLDKENIDLKYLIITDAYQWYVIESAWFEKHFFRNASFRKQYEEWRDKKKVTPDTELFYTAIAKPAIDKIEEDTPCAYFDIRKYGLKESERPSPEDEKRLIALYKLLSPGHLLKAGFEDDSNKLDEKFYKELLHIIGLEEVKEGSKFVIRRCSHPKPGSLMENAISLLQTEGYDKVPYINQYGATIEERLFNIALELCITWINRILFIKLLEGQLVSYQNGDKDFLFLNTKTIPDYGELFKLFHKVLAVDLDKRDAGLKKKYSKVPYLNSSLFEISELEDITIKINSLDSSLPLEFIGATILKDTMKQSKHASLPALDYLFKFLNAYDFASSSTEEIDEENKTLINASVLGKVFEKINGYKDGSIYTPGFITMYMCRQSIRQAVLQKFKEAYKWNIDEFDDLKNYIIDRRSKKEILEFNALINSLHICDPAVGSGHFLVSALNEIIAIKSELRILADKDGVRLDCDINIENDEINVLINTHGEEDFFEYKVFKGMVKEDTQRIQKTLFHEKETIIENCLFGVDINPNSVKICRLRLWIELLKNAYYRKEDNYTDLETLPNIDINIKCGNSLISRFPLDADLKKALKSIKYDIAAYRGFVNDYKNAKDRELKKGLVKIINSIKKDFHIEIGRYDPKYIKLQKLQYEFNQLVAPNIFKEEEVDYGNRNYKKEKEERIKELEKEISDLTKEVKEIKSNAIYKNALEWRFEFPEVLNNNGDFEGFDVVIGNPPYISAINLKKSMTTESYSIFKSNYETAKGTIDLFVYFFERGLNLLKNNSPLTYITPNRYLSVSYGEALRNYLYNHTNINQLIDYSHVRVFKEASTYPVVTMITKLENQNRKYDFKVGKFLEECSAIQFKEVNSQKLNFIEGHIWGYLLNDKMDITEKVIKQSVSLKDCAKINATSTTAEADDFGKIIVQNKGLKLINTGTIDKYECLWGKHTLIDSGKKYLTPYLEKNLKVIGIRRMSLYTSPKIILAKIALSTEAYYDEQGEYASINTNCFHTFNKDYSPKYILAWLNSKLFQYTFECFFDGLKMAGGYLLYSAPNVEKMFIKMISLKAQKPFITLVDKIISLKAQGQDTTELEAKIDTMVYELYGLTEEEIKIVEGKE